MASEDDWNEDDLSFADDGPGGATEDFAEDPKPIAEQAKAEAEDPHELPPHENDDLLTYSQKVQKRIKKETAKVYAERQAREAAEAERDQLRALLGNQQAQQNLATLEAQREAKRKEWASIKDEAFDDESLAKLNAVEEELSGLNMDIVNLKRGVQAPTRQPEPQAPARPVNDPQAAWLERNQAYQTNPRYQQAVDQVFYQLRDEEGLNPEHPNFYKELDKRLQAPRHNGSAVSPPAREGGNGERMGGFTAIDAENMRIINMNPNDPKDRKKYLQSQKELA
jgi:hypothetical protein